MGSRGPMRVPGSRRDQAEVEAASRISILSDAKNAGVGSVTNDGGDASGQRPRFPSGLPSRVAQICEEVLTNMLSAGIQAIQHDVGTITQAARCQWASELAEAYADSDELDAKGKLQAMTLLVKTIAESGKWQERIGATPAARARIGIKPVPEKKMSRLEKMLAKKEGR